jgi:4-hydroxybenzoate polyprenyltransferase
MVSTGAERMALANLVRAFSLQLKCRRTEVFMWPWVTAVGCMIASRGFPPIIPLATVILSMIAIAICVYTYNDVTDIELDKLNPIKKNRAVPSGTISTREAMDIVYISGPAGIVLALLTDSRAFTFMMIWAALFILYSTPQIRLKKRLLLKEVTIGLGMFLCTVAGGMIVGEITPSVLFAGVFFAVFVSLGFPAFRDTTDMKEDKLYGVKSLAVLLSWKTKLEIVILLILAIMTLTPLTYITFNFNVILPILIVGTCFLVLRFLFPLLNRFEELQYQKAYKSMFVLFVTSQIALILGSLPLTI